MRVSLNLASSFLCVFTYGTCGLLVPDSVIHLHSCGWDWWVYGCFVNVRFGLFTHEHVIGGCVKRSFRACTFVDLTHTHEIAVCVM